MKKTITVTTCDRTGCDQSTRDRAGWGRWQRDGRATPVDLCPTHDREVCQLVASVIPPARSTRAHLEAVG